MKTYQVEINETLCMTIEIKAKNAEQAEAIVSYKNEDYILDADHFTGVDFITREKEMDAQNKAQKYRGQER